MFSPIIQPKMEKFIDYVFTDNSAKMEKFINYVFTHNSAKNGKIHRLCFSGIMYHKTDSRKNRVINENNKTLGLYQASGQVSRKISVELIRINFHNKENLF